MCVCVTLLPHYPFMEFPVNTIHKSFVSLSLSLHLSVFLCCCVAPGNTVMCPPSVPASLSLCPCHLQLLCETRHNAGGREGGRDTGREGGSRGKERREKRNRFIDRGINRLVSSKRKLNKYMWHPKHPSKS